MANQICENIEMVVFIFAIVKILLFEQIFLKSMNLFKGNTTFRGCRFSLHLFCDQNKGKYFHSELLITVVYCQ